MRDTAPILRACGRTEGRLTLSACLTPASVAVALVMGLGVPAPAPAQAPPTPRGQTPAQPALLKVAVLGCKEGVQLTSKGATLSQLLRRMSQTLHFDHEYWAQEDPVLNLDMRSQPIEAMAFLSGQANLIVRYAPDRRCANRWRIAAVWVLPAGETLVGNYRVERARPPAPAATAQASDPNDDGSRGVDEYMRAHGLVPAAPAASAAEGG